MNPEAMNGWLGKHSRLFSIALAVLFLAMLLLLIGCGGEAGPDEPIPGPVCSPTVTQCPREVGP
jgi:hypothetical protein